MKATAVGFSNIAFIKYWGKKDPSLRLPLNSSLSMNLSNLQTKTTVEFSPKFKKDIVVIDNKENPNDQQRVIKHLDRIRKLSGNKLFAKVASVSNFPASTGLSSSASGFAALTLAATRALNLNLQEKELSILARLASGSACRSIPGGFVEWIKGTISEKSYAYTVFPEYHWEIVDIVAIVSEEKKQVPTSDAQKSVLTSPFLSVRLNRIETKIKELKTAIKEKDFSKFGEMIEAESLEFHAIMMTQNPSFIYIYPPTLSLMHTVRHWRKEGLEVYFTINTGHNIHFICQEKDKDKLIGNLKAEKEAKDIIINYPAGSAHIINENLF